MKINEFNIFLDLVEDALLYLKDITPCHYGQKKINVSLSALSSVRSESPRLDDQRFLEYICSDLSANAEEILADQKGLSCANHKIAPTLPSPTLSLTIDSGNYSSISEKDQRLASIRSEMIEDDEVIFPTPNFENTNSDYCSNTHNPAYQKKIAVPEINEQSDVEVIIDKSILFNRYHSAMIESGHVGEPVKKSGIFIDNFSHFINSCFSPSLSLDSLIMSFAMSGDANKIFGHKKISGDLILKIPSSYFKASVSRSGYEASTENIEKVRDCFLSKFVFEKKYSEIMKESLLILDNDSVIDLLMGFE